MVDVGSGKPMSPPVPVWEGFRPPVPEGTGTSVTGGTDIVGNASVDESDEDDLSIAEPLSEESFGIRVFDIPVPMGAVPGRVIPSGFDDSLDLTLVDSDWVGELLPARVVVLGLLVSASLDDLLPLVGRGRIPVPDGTVVGIRPPERGSDGVTEACVLGSGNRPERPKLASRSGLLVVEVPELTSAGAVGLVCELD